MADKVNEAPEAAATPEAEPQADPVAPEGSEAAQPEAEQAAEPEAEPAKEKKYSGVPDFDEMEELGEGDKPKTPVTGDGQELDPQAADPEAEPEAAAEPEAPAAEADTPEADAGELDTKGERRYNTRIKSLVGENKDLRDQLVEARKGKEQPAAPAPDATPAQGEITFAKLDLKALPEELGFTEKAPVVDTFVDETTGETDDAAYQLATAQYIEKLRDSVETHNVNLRSEQSRGDEIAANASERAAAVGAKVSQFNAKQTEHVGKLEEAAKTSYGKAAEVFRAIANENMVKVIDPVSQQPSVRDNSGLVEAVLSDDIGPQLVQYLGDNPTVQDELMGLSPVQVGERLAGIKTAIKVKSAKIPEPRVKPSVPAPPTAGGGATGAAKRGIAEIAEDGDMEEYMEVAGTGKLKA